ncbi:MAG: exodeoxyribonuclease VII small subunit [Candidatus Puniceispirillum sp.]|nr:exodeoxyribonuclease VII small subunit [Candidatus Pelagibacter sp.]MBA4283612.1 exodeoxyribonuclease VII small subunit [Candidatus Puniceispirillum sp.]
MENSLSLSFEEALTELESLVRKLEDGKLPLEEAVSAYERGTFLKSYCEEKLSTAKTKIDQINANSSEITLKPYAISNMSA